jgi:hypothetical protein
MGQLEIRLLHVPKITGATDQGTGRGRSPGVARREWQASDARPRPKTVGGEELDGSQNQRRRLLSDGDARLGVLEPAKHASIADHPIEQKRASHGDLVIVASPERLRISYNRRFAA